MASCLDKLCFSLEMSFVRLLFHTLVCIHASVASLALKMKVFLQDIKWNLARKLSYDFFLQKPCKIFISTRKASFIVQDLQDKYLCLFVSNLAINVNVQTNFCVGTTGRGSFTVYFKWCCIRTVFATKQVSPAEGRGKATEMDATAIWSY